MHNGTPQTDFIPEITVLCCREALAGDFDFEGPDLPLQGCRARRILLPCAGKIEASHLLKYLAAGVDGIEIISCTDAHCPFLDGNTRVERRVAQARWLLSQVAMAPDRIGLDHGEGLTAAQVTALIEARAAAIRALGRNPMKKETTS